MPRGPRIVRLCLLLALGGCSRPLNETGEALGRTGELVALSGGEAGAAGACFTCHGLQGGGDGVSAPRLAGLDAGYLHKQLEDYASDRRSDPTMTPIAARLTPPQRRAAAGYYAGMARPRSEAVAGPAPDIWRRGDPSRGVPACATCHGATGLGVGAGNPAVAGQPAAYTLDQIDRWRSGKRRNDARGTMSMAVAALTAAEASAIARWLERQSAVPAPDTGAASVSAAASAAAQPAPLHEAHRRDR